LWLFVVLLDSYYSNLFNCVSICLNMLSFVWLCLTHAVMLKFRACCHTDDCCTKKLGRISPGFLWYHQKESSYVVRSLPTSRDITIIWPIKGLEICDRQIDRQTDRQTDTHFEMLVHGSIQERWEKNGWLSKFHSDRSWGDARLSLGPAQAPPN